MEFDLDQRTATLSLGEFSAFNIGPRDPSDHTGAQGLWRARLGTRWHQELRAKAAASTPAASFEVPITGRVFHGGWTLTLTGRIDQFLPAPDARTPAILREIKTTLDPLPAPEEDLRAAHPDYFAQLATYLALRRIENPSEKIRGELVFVEAGSGLLQTIAFTHADESPFQVRLERVAEFLNLRLRARERLRNLRFHSPFPELRDGQQTTQADLAAALATHRQVLFTAPTGFGKTGALLECALGAMKSGRYSRLLYLTSKATGQLQVLRTLRAMTAPPQTAQIPTPKPQIPKNIPASAAPPIGHWSLDIGHSTPVAAWHVRPKHEHCLDPVCFCQRREFNHPDSDAQRWKKHGLSRFYLFEDEARDIPALRSAGEAAQICPYEITRTALNDWGLIVLCDSLGRAAQLSDCFAPEHLELLVEDPESLAEQIQHAGAIFMGPHTPEAVGDYLAGPNHTLPTSGTARFAGALSVETFLRHTSLIHFNRAALEATGAAVITLAESEGLHSHAESVRRRLA